MALRVHDVRVHSCTQRADVGPARCERAAHGSIVRQLSCNAYARERAHAVAASLRALIAHSRSVQSLHRVLVEP